MMNHTPSAGSMIHRYCIKFTNSQTQTTFSVSAASPQVTILCYKNFTVRKFLWAKIAPKAHMSFASGISFVDITKYYRFILSLLCLRYLFFWLSWYLCDFVALFFPPARSYIDIGMITFYNMIWCNRHGPRFWRNPFSNAYWIRILQKRGFWWKADEPFDKV